MDKVGCDVICRSHSARSDREQYRTCPTKLTKRELEDLYFALVEENLELKKTTNGQQDRIKVLSTKMQRMSSAQKIFKPDSRKDCCNAKAVINQQNEIITDLNRANERMSDRIRKLNMRLCSAKQFCKSVTPRSVRCQTATSPYLIKNSSYTQRQQSQSTLKLAISNHNLSRSTFSTKYIQTEKYDSTEKDKNSCENNKCSSLMDELKQKINNLQEALSNTREEYSSSAKVLQQELEKSRNDNLSFRSERVAIDQELQQRIQKNVTLTASLRAAEGLCNELRTQLSIEKMKVAEMEIRLKAATISNQLTRNMEDTISNQLTRNMEDTISNQLTRNMEDTISNQLTRNMEDTISNQLTRNMEDTISNQLTRNMEDTISNQLTRNMEDTISNQLTRNMEDTISNQLTRNMEDTISNQLTRNMEDTISNQLTRNMEDTISNQLTRNMEDTISNQLTRNMEDTISNQLTRNMEDTISNQLTRNMEDTISNQLTRNMEDTISNQLTRNMEDTISNQLTRNMEDTITSIQLTGAESTPKNITASDESKLSKNTDDSGYVDAKNTENFINDQALHNIIEDLTKRIIVLQTQVDALTISPPEPDNIHKYSIDNTNHDEKTEMKSILPIPSIVEDTSSAIEDDFVKLSHQIVEHDGDDANIKPSSPEKDINNTLQVPVTIKNDKWKRNESKTKMISNIIIHRNDKSKQHETSNDVYIDKSNGVCDDDKEVTKELNTPSTTSDTSDEKTYDVPGKEKNNDRDQEIVSKINSTNEKDMKSVSRRRMLKKSKNVMEKPIGLKSKGKREKIIGKMEKPESTVRRETEYHKMGSHDEFTYTLEIDKNSQGSSPDDTDDEISSMTDLSEEKEYKGTPQSVLSPGERRYYSTQSESELITTSTTNFSLSEGEIPDITVRRKSYGDNLETQEKSKNTAPKMEETLQVIGEELARCKRLLSSQRSHDPKSDYIG